MIPPESRFESDPEELLDPPPGLPEGWSLDAPDADRPDDVRRLVELLREDEQVGRGWPGSGEDDVVPAIGGEGLRTRANLVVRDENQAIQGWAGVHDRSEGRMVLRLLIARELAAPVRRAGAEALLAWVDAQAREVAAARGLPVQTIDTGAFTGDEAHTALLARAGFDRVRTWWQQTRPVAAEEAELVPDPARWSQDGVVIRLVSRDGGGEGPAPLPDRGDLRAVHDVLEESFTDHFGSTAETFDEWLFRQREVPGHRWDQWWLAELLPPDGVGEPTPAGALIGTVADGSDHAYVSYVGVVAAARGRGVAKRLLRTIVADAARRGRDEVGLEVDSESSTGADRLYASMGWRTSWTTESWHREIAIGPDGGPA